MALFGNKKSTSKTVNTNSDERIAVSDFGSVSRTNLRAEAGATVNFGLGGADLQGLLGFKDQDVRAGQREALQNSLAGNDGAGIGGSGLLIAGGVLLFVFLIARPK